MRPIIKYPKQLKKETIEGLQNLWDTQVKTWQKNCPMKCTKEKKRKDE